MSNINDLRIGINQALDKEFPNITIYGEEIKQGFKEPCFFIKVLNSSQNKELNIRYNRSISFDIHYFSDNRDINSDCNNMADKLYEVLEYVDVNNNLYRANDMKHELIDGVLHFMIQFDYRIVKENQKIAKMQKLIQEVKLRNA